MGKPEDFGAEPIEQPSFQSGRDKYTKKGNIKTGKRLFRNPDDQKLAGVCSGISAYFGIDDAVWVRLLFVLFTLFGGFGIMTYLILWFIVPEAITSSDKLAMKGEPTTVENIAKKVEEEISELGDKISEWGKDFGSKKKRKM
ncbi:MAG: PspC domain-containing protein [Saprospiraceae bacterium]|nr:PspC domain-containing protein [Saprospiraceae bacterium]